MINIVARFVTRGTGIKGEGRVDIFIGAAFKGQKILKPNHVYQLTEFDGEIMLRDMGPSAIHSQSDKSLLPANWNHGVSAVMERAGKHLILTQAEFTELCEQENKCENKTHTKNSKKAAAR